MSAATTTKSPSYQWYPRDYLADTAHLEPMEDLLYRRLLDYQWLHGAVPAALPAIAKSARLPVGAVKKAWPAIESYFPVDEDPTGRKNRRMERIRKMQQDRAAAGRHGGHTTQQNRSNVPSKTEANEQAKPNLAVASAFAVAPARNSTEQHITAREAFVAECPEHLQTDVREALIESPDGPSLLRSIRAIEGGMHGAAYPVAVIAQALQELKAAPKWEVTPQNIRTFCRTIVGRPLKATGTDGVAGSIPKARRLN